MDKTTVRLTRANRQQVAALLASAPDGHWVTISEPTRSLDQNALLHSLCSDVSKQKEWAGKMRHTVDWKRLFVDGYLRIENTAGLPLVPSLDYSGVVPLGEPTRAMGVKRMADLLTYIESWGAEHDVRFSAPQWMAA